MRERQNLALVFTDRNVPLARVRHRRLPSLGLGLGIAAAQAANLIRAQLRRRAFVTAVLVCASPFALGTGATSAGAEPNQDARDDSQAGPTEQEIRTVLPLLAKYSETRQLAAELQASIEQGDLVKARQLMERLMEASTFGALVSDRPNDPQPDVSARDVNELRKALEEERERSRSLTSEHTRVSEELASVQASLTQAETRAAENEELRKALEQARERSDALTREHAALAAELTVLRENQERNASATSELREALDHERQRSASLQGALTEKQDRGAAADAEAAALKKALEDARERSRALEQEVAALTLSVRTLEERGAAAAAESSELTKALNEERERSRSASREYAALAEKLASIESTQSIASQPSKAADPVLNRPPVAPTAPQVDSQVDLRVSPAGAANPIVARAEALLRSGDVSGARLLLERAAASGDVNAIVLLAQTYDPRTLASLGVIGIRGDVLKAEELYARARALRAEQGSVPAQAVR